MPRYRRKRSGRGYGPGLGGYLRGLPAGLTKVLLASGIMAVGAYVADVLKGSLVIPITDTLSLDLGFIPGVAVTFGGLFLFMQGLRQLTRTRL